MLRENDAGEHDDTDPSIEELDAGSPELGPLEPGGWAQLDFEARKQFMRDVVVPAVRPLFQEFDPERFAAVSCMTCHGGGARAGTFSMPSPDLPALDSESLKNPPESQKPILAFMRTTLKPKLAELLGKQKAPEFRCSVCHTSVSAP